MSRLNEASRGVKYSLLIPVYNRPEEVAELLESLTRQTLSREAFDVIIVEDGSALTSQHVAESFATRLTLHYVVQDNAGPGAARNTAAQHATGEYLIILDSDCVLPPRYLEAIDRELTASPCEAFGGPDRAHESFTPVQKAISYSMTSFFTTGGIRGGRKKLDKFYPRSFNMGVRADVYRRLGGFSRMRFGEDIDFSIRIFQSGARCRLFPEAWVWHKRRTDFRKFFRQVHNSGIARINLYKKHPTSLKAVHLLPAAFTLGNVCLLLGAPFLGWLVLPLCLYVCLVFLDATRQSRSARVGALSVVASYVQLFGYGAGFLRAWWWRCLCGRDEEMQAFRKTFYQ